MGKVHLIIDEEMQPNKQIIDKLELSLNICVKKHNIKAKEVEVNLTFVSAEEMMELNNSYRKINQATDVLSFPQYHNLAEIQGEKKYVVLGDVVIALDIAFIQAEEYGHTLEREILYLFVHSVLHLLGFDHEKEDDKKLMRELEENIMEEIGIVR